MREKEQRYSREERKKVENHRDKQDARLKRPRYNRNVLYITYFYIIVAFLMIAYLLKFVVIDSENKINNPYNTRQYLLEKKVIRGDIVSSDGVVLATSEKDKVGRYNRYYPYDNMFCHVVGKVEDGRTGLELSAGFSMLASDINPLQKLMNDFESKKSEGNNCITTINYELQKTAYESLANYNGAVVAMNPRNGKILAMVSKPDFNPNTESRKPLGTVDEENSAYLNRATQGLYPPGSTFKILTAMEYIKENETYSDYSYDCKGEDSFEGNPIHCFSHEVHGVVSLEKSMAHSCNTSFANIGMEINNNSLKKLCENYYFNKLLPVNFPHNKGSFKLDEDSNTDETIQTAIGQGETLVTPLQNLMIVLSVANKGKLMLPQLVDHVESAQGKAVSKYKAKSLGEKCPKKIAKQLNKYLMAVCEYGTASALSALSYPVAGKTGSAEIDSSGTSHAWFVGYAPADNPKIAVAIVVEGAGTGSQYAVPIARNMFMKYLGA